MCNIIVLLNMLIAMMSNSYTLISERSDTEWKFARSKEDDLFENLLTQGNDSLQANFGCLTLEKGILWLYL